MYKFIENNFDNLKVDKNLQIIDIFDWVFGTKKVFIKANCKLAYLIVAKNAKIEIDVFTEWSGSDIQIFAIFVGDKKPLRVNVKTQINHSNTVVKKHFVSLVWDDSKMDVDGSINVSKWIKNVVWNLLEENVILWKKVSIKIKPALNVASKDVMTSHGAKIEKIGADKLFYMTSKGLNPANSQKLVVEGYVSDILSHFPGLDDKISNKIRKIIRI